MARTILGRTGVPTPPSVCSRSTTRSPRRGAGSGTFGSPCEADPNKRHRSAKAAEPVAAGLDPPRLQRPPCLRGRRAVGAAGRAAIAAEAMPGGLEAWRNRARPDPRRIVRREELLGMILLNAAPRVRGILGTHDAHVPVRHDGGSRHDPQHERRRNLASLAERTVPGLLRCSRARTTGVAARSGHVAHGRSASTSGSAAGSHLLGVQDCTRHASLARARQMQRQPARLSAGRVRNGTEAKRSWGMAQSCTVGPASHPPLSGLERHHRAR